MKNIVLSAVAVLAMSSFAVAGGDIAPVEEPIVVVEEVAPVSTGGLYLGLAYSVLNATSTDYWGVNGVDMEENYIDTDFSEVMIQAGYKINDFVAIEGRYWFGIEDTIAGDIANIGGLVDFDSSVDAWGIYVKPMYPVSEAFNIYALLGYAGTEYDVSATDGRTTADWNSDTLDGFSWGLGAEYAFSNNVAIFIDYTNLYDDEIDHVVTDRNGVDRAATWENEVDTINFGVTYNF